MKRIVAPGTLNLIDRVFIRDTSVTSRVAGLTGLTNLTAGLTWYFMRDGALAPVSVPLVAMTLGTWVSGGIAEVDAVHMPGQYEIGIPNAEFVSGSAAVSNQLRGAANMEEIPWQYEIDAGNFGSVGAIAWTITMYDLDGTTPLAGVAVYVSADISGTQRSQTRITDDLGHVTFNLDAGLIYVWPSRYDRAFSGAPYTETVA